MDEALVKNAENNVNGEQRRDDEHGLIGERVLKGLRGSLKRGVHARWDAQFALRLHDGKVLWQDQVFPDNQTGFDFNSAPVIVGRRLFATNKDGIYAWDRVSRRRLWSTQVTDPLAGGVTVLATDSSQIRATEAVIAASVAMRI